MSILRTIKQEHYLEIYEALENDEKMYHRSKLNKPPATTTDKENSGASQQNNIQAPKQTNRVIATTEKEAMTPTADTTEADQESQPPTDPEKTRHAKSLYPPFHLCLCLSYPSESVRDLSASTFVLALRRFFSATGECSKMFFDNAKMFPCVSRYLRVLGADTKICDSLVHIKVKGNSLSLSLHGRKGVGFGREWWKRRKTSLGKQIVRPYWITTNSTPPWCKCKPSLIHDHSCTWAKMTTKDSLLYRAIDW